MVRHTHTIERRGLSWAFGLTATVFLVELAGGWYANSLALLSDAGHMLADVGALGLALFALWLSTRPATLEKTYGYYRMEILAAFINGLLLWLIVILVGVEAVQRLSDPPPLRSGVMLAVAAVGLAANLCCVAILHRTRKESLNVKGAFLHVLSDALGSVAALAAGLITWLTGWWLADPLLSLFICLLILWSSWKLLRESINVLMEGTPYHIDLDEVRAALTAIEGVRDIHDLHVWTVTSGMEALSGHALVQDYAHSMEVLKTARRICYERFHIEHVTLQLETESLEAEEMHI